MTSMELLATIAGATQAGFWLAVRAGLNDTSPPPQIEPWNYPTGHDIPVASWTAADDPD